MKKATVASLAVLFGAGLAFAGPAAALDEGKCAELWSSALAEGDATPYIVDFDQVDADGDGQISEAEFKDGCAQDLVQEAAAAPEAMEPTEPAEPGAEATPESSQEY